MKREKVRKATNEERERTPLKDEGRREDEKPNPRGEPRGSKGGNGIQMETQRERGERRGGRDTDKSGDGAQRISTE